MLVWSLLLLSTGGPASGCNALDADEMMALVRKVETASDRDASVHRLVELAVYWDGLCEAERRDASSDAVRAIARLLRLGPPRDLLASMLFDIGPNLRAADPELKLAIADEKRRDRYYLRQTQPVAPTNYGVAADSFRCLRSKARTGRTDARACRILVAVKAEERAERADAAPQR